MKFLLHCIIRYTLCFGLIAQEGLQLSAQQKGVSPIQSPNQQTAAGVTYAVVAGISDYQDPAIPDLKYAAKDADAFGQYLKSKAGGGLNQDQIKILLNEHATLGQFASALDWLLEVCKPGDRAIIYFSGHGDVERKTITQPGFLLCWDAPARVYMSGGAFGLAYLEEVINTLSSQNNVKVTMIADACHSGKLSGSQIGGVHATAANLARQYSNEIKILSCQPNEFSLEGEQWGGGRGVFSYHLVDGLVGLADRNRDGNLILNELDRYLEDKVTPEAAPQSQIPVIIGNKAEVISKVDPESLSALQKRKEGEIVVFVKTESRGLEEQIVSKLDSLTKWKYERFKMKLEGKEFLSPAEDCADFYYRQLEKDSSLNLLHGVVRRNYAAALQDDAQQVLNRFLRSELMELSLSKKTAIQKYIAYPAYLERAAELLGKEHYMYPLLLARKYFFEGYLSILSNKNKDEAVGRKALEKLTKALTYQADMPHIYWAMNFAYGYNLLKPDSAEYYTEKAVSLAPSWQLPYANLVFMYAEHFGNLEKASYFLNKINEIDSTSLIALYSAGNLYDLKGNSKQAELKLCKAISLDSNFIFAYNSLGNIYLYSGNSTAAELQYQKAISLDPEYPMAHTNLGIVYYTTQRKNLAEKEFLKAHELDPGGPYPNYNLACFYANNDKMDVAYSYLENALKFGWTSYKTLQEDPELAPLRSDTSRWDRLMRNYFPNIHK